MYKKSFVGRGSDNQQTGRFEQSRLELVQIGENGEPAKIRTEYFDDQSKTIVSQNHSPDIHFNYSLNPYRGCSHGCSYCYARPTHEYLGWGPGLDFESRIVVKRNAAELFRQWMMTRSPDQIEPIMLSGVTDCYQPCERELKLTRQCLETALRFRHPVQLITKNRLVCRDLDLLTEMAALNLVTVTVSLTTLDQSLTKTMEPRTSSPQSRLDTMARLSQANVPVIASVSPIIPGLNDEEIPALLKQVSDHGATYAFYVMLRLPITVRDIFIQWLEQHFPDRQEKILARIKATRGGELNTSVFGERMRGTGLWAEQIHQMFTMFAKRAGIDQRPSPLRIDLFSQPDQLGRRQKQLF